MSSSARVRRGFLFDIDGTLVDSNRQHAQAWSEALRENGFAVSVEDVLPLIGMGGDKLLQRTTGLDAASRRGREISERSGAIFNERYLQTIQPFPRCRALLVELRAREVLIGIATSAGAEDSSRLLERAGARDLIDLCISSDDAADSKPDPDIVSVAVGRSGLTRAEVLLVGDTPYDVIAASRAGIGCVAVRSGGWDDQALAGSLLVLDDVGSLLERLGDPPLAGWLRGKTGS